MISFHIFITLISFFIYFFLKIIFVLYVLIKKNTIPFFRIWFLIFYIFPVFGVFFYFIFGELRFKKSYIHKSKFIWKLMIRWVYSLHEINFWDTYYAPARSSIANTIFQLCKNKKNFFSMTGNELQTFTNSKKIIQNIIYDIEKANYSIDMIFYIWSPGGIADAVAKSLIKASQRGIHCRLILDSVGSAVFFSSKWVNRMHNAGIKIVEALKVNLFYIFLQRIDLRQHRKIIIIDHSISYTGSMNLIDSRFFKKKANIGEWIDIMVRIQGPLSLVLGSIFSYDWAMETGNIIFPDISKKIDFSKRKNFPIIQTVASGPLFSENTIRHVLLTAIYSARNQLIMTTPYFIPSDDLLDAICNAAYRGVDVNLILPFSTDFILVNWASCSFFDELLASGVKVYQFQKGLLHTKSIIIDKKISLIGTLNLDIRSLWLNFEITLIIDSAHFAKKLFNIHSHYIQYSKLLDKKSWSNRCYSNRFLERIGYLFSPFL